MVCNNVHMALKYVLLTLLSREKQTGYEIVKSFESAVGYFWNASHQQVYRELAKLSDSGEVKFAPIKQGDKPDKKLYRITASGKRSLRDWVNEPVVQSPAKDLLLVKLLNLNKNNTHIMVAELERMLEMSAERMQVYDEIQRMHYPPARRAGLPLEELALYLALRKGITSLASHIAWLQEARNAIAKADA